MKLSRFFFSEWDKDRGVQSEGYCDKGFGEEWTHVLALSLVVDRNTLGDEDQYSAYGYAALNHIIGKIILTCPVSG